MIIQKIRPGARELNDGLDSASCLAYGREFGSFRKEEWGYPENIDGKKYIVWRAVYWASPQEEKTLEVFFDNDANHAYFGIEKVNRHPIEPDLAVSIFEHFVRKIPKERKLWAIQKINESGGGLKSFFDEHADFYCEQEKKVIERYFRMLPALGKIFARSRELALIKMQEELSKDQQLKKTLENIINEKGDFESHLQELEKIDQKYGVGALPDPDNAISTFIAAYEKECSDIIERIEACRRGRATGRIPLNEFEEVLKGLEKEWDELTRRYAVQWEKLRARLPNPENHPKDFLRMLVAYQNTANATNAKNV